jgi:DNA-binding beta-propeller fold protein YncE
MPLAFVMLGVLLGASAVPAQGDFRFGPFERAIEQLGSPAGVAIDAAGRIYVTQSASGDVAVVSRDGTRSLLLRDRDPDVGLVSPRGIAVDGDEVFVTDAAGHRVHVFDRAGTLQRRWGGHGRTPGSFLGPSGIAVGGDRVCVADTGNDRVQVLGRDGSFIMALGGSGRGPGEMRRPSDVAIAPDGSIVVADAGNNRIQVFSRDGDFRHQWGDWGAFPGLMDEPSCVTVDGDGVYVVDTRNHRIQVFDLEGAVCSNSQNANSARAAPDSPTHTCCWPTCIGAPVTIRLQSRRF